MRNFSDFEKVIIQKLLKSKGGFHELLPKEFISDAKILIHYLPNGQVRYEFKSDNYDFAKGLDEFNKTISLLKYLIDENLVHVIYPAATSFIEFTNEESLSIGLSESDKVQVKLLNHTEIFIPNFFRHNRDNEFECTPDLKTLARNNYLNWDQVKHRQIVRITIIGILATIIGSIVVPFSLSYWQFKRSYETLDAKIEIANSRLIHLDKKIEEDSIKDLNGELKLQIIKMQFDSLKKQFHSNKREVELKPKQKGVISK